MKTIIFITMLLMFLLLYGCSCSNQIQTYNIQCTTKEQFKDYYCTIAGRHYEVKINETNGGN